jgi:cytidyltransferase-like protein
LLKQEESALTHPAHIIALEDFPGIRDNLGMIVATSGGYDPIHPGHASCLLESKKYGEALVVIVNGDGYLRRKKGRAFMDLQTRCRVVSYIKGVDYVIPFEYNDDDSVCEALRIIRPHIFTKGGDRTDLSNIPEWHICTEHKIEIITGVGVDKDWSSSDYLRAWGEYWAKKPDEMI